MSQNLQKGVEPQRPPWWKTIGPALITACVVFGPGSLVISANVGATYGYELLWLLALAGLVMGGYMTMSARVGVSGRDPLHHLAREVNRPSRRSWASCYA